MKDLVLHTDNYLHARITSAIIKFAVIIRDFASLILDRARWRQDFGMKSSVLEILLTGFKQKTAFIVGITNDVYYIMTAIREEKREDEIDNFR